MPKNNAILQACLLLLAETSALVARPKLIVFDLDQTLWTPELYKLRQLANYPSAGPPGPIADQDVRLYAGARAALEELATDEAWKDTALACASRTNKGPWARQLLRGFTVAGKSLDELLVYQEIFTGDKNAHLNNLQQKSEIAFADMLFFDDARDGKYGNCAKVAEMGVCSAHCPDGITTEVWTNALAEFSRRKEAGETMGTVVDAPGVQVPEGLVAATIKMFSDAKNFGFVRVEGVKGDVFFHGSSVALGVQACALAPGIRVQVRIGVDSRGRRQCDTVVPVESGDTLDEVERPVLSFSMNQPFASLVAHGGKTPRDPRARRPRRSGDRPHHVASRWVHARASGCRRPRRQDGAHRRRARPMCTRRRGGRVRDRGGDGSIRHDNHGRTVAGPRRTHARTARGVCGASTA